MSEISAYPEQMMVPEMAAESWASRIYERVADKVSDLASHIPLPIALRAGALVAAVAVGVMGPGAESQAAEPLPKAGVSNLQFAEMAETAAAQEWTFTSIDGLTRMIGPDARIYSVPCALDEAEVNTPVYQGESLLIEDGFNFYEPIDETSPSSPLLSNDEFAQSPIQPKVCPQPETEEGVYGEWVGFSARTDMVVHTESVSSFENYPAANTVWTFIQSPNSGTRPPRSFFGLGDTVTECPRTLYEADAMVGASSQGELAYVVSPSDNFPHLALLRQNPGESNDAPMATDRADSFFPNVIVGDSLRMSSSEARLRRDNATCAPGEVSPGRENVAAVYAARGDSYIGADWGQQ